MTSVYNKNEKENAKWVTENYYLELEDISPKKLAMVHFPYMLIGIDHPEVWETLL